MDAMINKLSSRDRERNRRAKDYEGMSPASTNSSVELGRKMSFTKKLDPDALVKKYLKLNVHPTSSRTGDSS